MERFTKYDIGKDKTSVQFFSIGVGKLLGPAESLLEKDLMILIISSGVVGLKKKHFEILLFRYVIGNFLPLGVLFAMLDPKFVKKKSKVSAFSTGLKSKTSLCFREHGVSLLFLPTLIVERMASQVFDRSVLFFSNKSL